MDLTAIAVRQLILFSNSCWCGNAFVKIKCATFVRTTEGGCFMLAVVKLQWKNNPLFQTLFPHNDYLSTSN